MFIGEHGPTDVILSRFITLKSTLLESHIKVLFGHKVSILRLRLDKKQIEIKTQPQPIKITDKIKTKTTLLCSQKWHCLYKFIDLCCQKKVTKIKTKKFEFICEQARLFKIYLISRRGYFLKYYQQFLSLKCFQCINEWLYNSHKRKRLYAFCISKRDKFV